jgi:hypothetical protein
LENLKNAVLSNWKFAALAFILSAVFMGFISGVEFPTIKKGSAPAASTASSPKVVPPASGKKGKKKAEPVVAAPSPVQEERGRGAATGGRGRSATPSK